MWTFIVTPVMSIVFTFLFSFVHIAANTLGQEEGKLSDDIEA
jgi:hypothetical protein